VLELARQGEFRRAQAELDRLIPGLERDQAGVYLLYHAGDLEGALALCRAARFRHPADEYLTRTQQEIALNLSRPESLTELQAPQAQALRASEAALEQGQLRSQGLVLACLLVLGGLLLLAQRTPRPDAKRAGSLAAKK
jgi:hypothetical protein